ncbi:MAG TPA: hypothetical protein PLV87_05380 [Opitutaceae bacterium]|nr:hypothetical protein [Opitutaceae bacterium]
MSEHQTHLPLESTFSVAPEAPPEMRDEIARVWGMPLGRRVAVSFRGGQFTSVEGVLELAAAPDYPWNPRQPLRLRIAGCDFSSRDIEHWRALQKYAKGGRTPTPSGWR